MQIIQSIQNRIYEIRGARVMLDRDLAAVYDVETRILKQDVKRNIDRFPKDFMFSLTKKEWNYMSSQIVMASEQIDENKVSNSSQIVISYNQTSGNLYTNLSQIMMSQKVNNTIYGNSGNTTKNI